MPSKPIVPLEKLSIAMSLLGVMAMGLVICHHLPTHPQGGILEWGVPWFYFAGGFWHASKSRKWSDEICIRARSLLVPYFLLNAIWFPIVFVANWIGWKYLGAELVVNGSVASIVRCLGLCPWAWPALVPTWFLRSLFAATILVGGIWAVLETAARDGRELRIVLRALTALALWVIVVTRYGWCPAEGHWADFFVFGIPLHGMACFALGGFVSTVVCVDCSGTIHPFTAMIRRQLMPVYVLHAAVIVTVGWMAKAFGCFGALATLPGDIAMWFAGVAGAIAIGEFMRRRIPNVSRVLFGGR